MRGGTYSLLPASCRWWCADPPRGRGECRQQEKEVKSFAHIKQYGRSGGSKGSAKIRKGLGLFFHISHDAVVFVTDPQ